MTLSERVVRVRVIDEDPELRWRRHRFEPAGTAGALASASTAVRTSTPMREAAAMAASEL